MTYEEIISGLRALEAKDFDYYHAGMDGPQRLDLLTTALGELPSPERAIPELFAVMERLPEHHPSCRRAAFLSARLRGRTEAPEALDGNLRATRLHQRHDASERAQRVQGEELCRRQLFSWRDQQILRSL